MPNKKKHILKVSDEDRVRVKRAASRQANLDMGITPYRTKVHKDKKKTIHRRRKHKGNTL